MSVKQELIILIAGISLMWVLYAGMTGRLEYIDNQLIEAGIDVMEWMR